MPHLSFTGRIAAFSFRHRWWVLAAWAVLLLAAVGMASGLGSVLTSEFKDLSGSESARAKRLADERFGRQPLVETVIVRSEQELVHSPAFTQVYQELAARLRATPGVAQVVTYDETADPSMLSDDGHAAIMSVVLAGTPKEADQHIEELLAVVETAAPAGYQVTSVGMASSDHELNEISRQDIESAERFGLPVALIVLVLAFGTVIAAGLPLLLGAAAILPAIGSVALIGRAFELSFFVTNMITMIGLAVGIDYSLFILGRYREELARGRPRPLAAALAADTSGRAVLFSGITVLLALSGLLLVRSNVFVSLGIGAIVVVIYAVLASLTLLPALLGALGGTVDRLHLPYLGRARSGGVFWGVVTRAVQRHPLLFALGSAGLLLAAALPLLTIDLGANGVETLPKETRTYQAVQALQRDFAAGRTEPMQVLVTGDLADPAVRAAIERLHAAVTASGDMQWLGVTPDERGQTALIQVASTVGGTSDAATAVLRELRQRLVPQAFAGSGASVLVGGNLASYVDMQHELDRKLPIVFAYVLGLSFVLLLLVFRSLAIPVKAILLNLLSVGTAYGLLVLVFQHGVGADLLGLTRSPQVEFWIPLFLFSILFGLSMDYHVFLLSRVQEEFHRTGDNGAAVAHGLVSTAGMITSAAAIMVAVFAAFASGRLVAIQQMGLGLAAAVLVDATLVRSVLVPASMQLLGRYNWWLPRWLAWLPRITVEGGSAPRSIAVEALPAAGD